ncbi:MAG: hypothetical protein B6I35_13340 [Anaerolineaceae bacterium 4572_32.2]|nr:MAG: hypothetical protein B6I35_13340 [Anaerolineaceae bacterium 4572_32.2]
MTESTRTTSSIQQALEETFDDARWLAVLRRLQFTGVADRGQILALPGLTRDKFSTLLDSCEMLAPGGILTVAPIDVHQPGVPGRPPTVYKLGKLGAALLRANGHPAAHVCGLTTETQIAHARAVLDVRLAATETGLVVQTEKTLPYTANGEERVLRPDNLITLPGGARALFEVEQSADLTLLRRIRDTVRRKATFFRAPEAVTVSSTVRVLIDLPHGRTWDETVSTWERATAIVAEEQSGDLGFRIVAAPLRTFLKRPDWGEPPDDARWESLFDPAQTTSFEPSPSNQKQERAVTKKQSQLPRALRRLSARDDLLIMRAFWQDLHERGPDLMYAHDRPPADPVFFDVMGIIYAASHPPDASSWERALHSHVSLYLLRSYLQMHQCLRQALSKAVARGNSSMRWSTPAITHRMQVVADTFLRYHGLRSGGALRVHILGPWGRDDGRGDFGIRVHIEPEALMGEEDGVVPTREEVAFAEQALSWVLFALFAYAGDIGVKHAHFW